MTNFIFRSSRVPVETRIQSIKDAAAQLADLHVVKAAKEHRAIAMPQDKEQLQQESAAIAETLEALKDRIKGEIRCVVPDGSTVRLASLMRANEEHPERVDNT